MHRGCDVAQRCWCGNVLVQVARNCELFGGCESVVQTGKQASREGCKEMRRKWEEGLYQWQPTTTQKGNSLRRQRFLRTHKRPPQCASAAGTSFVVATTPSRVVLQLDADYAAWVCATDTRARICARRQVAVWPHAAPRGRLPGAKQPPRTLREACVHPGLPRRSGKFPSTTASLPTPPLRRQAAH